MSTAKFDTLSTLDGSYSVPVSRVAQGAAAAWVNFNGTGTVAIRAAFNVSSITDNGTGDYTVNFTNAMPDADYAVLGTCEYGAGGLAQDVTVANTTAPTTSAVRMFVSAGTAGSVILYDSVRVYIAIFR